MFRQLTKSLESLEAGNYSVCWVIGDDASPDGAPEQLLSIPFDTFIFTRQKNIGQPKNYLATVNRAREMGNWVLVVDDDGLIEPDCLQRLFWLTEKYPDSDCYGAFNSPYHPSDQVFDDHVLKHSTCEHGRFFRSSWSGFGATLQPIPVLRPSAIQHCGKYGLNGIKDDLDAEFGQRTALSAR